MSEGLWLLLSLSLSGTLLAGLTASLYRALHRRVPATFFAVLWALVLLRMVCPVGGAKSLSHRAVSELEEMASPAPGQESAWQEEGFLWSPSEVGDGQSASFWLLALSLLWGMGAAAVLLWRLCAYAVFVRTVLRRARPAPDAAWELLHAMTPPGRRAPALLQSEEVAAPLLMGLLRPRILLPAGEFAPCQLESMLLHELTHWRRCDLAVKWGALLIAALHWFNPAAWWALRQLDFCCELSCDEHVVRAWPASRRADYGELLLLLSHPFRSPTTGISASFGAEKKRLKERLVSIMNPKKVKKQTLLLMSAALLVMAISSAALGAYAGQGDMGAQSPADALYTPVMAAPEGESSPQEQIVLSTPFEEQEEIRVTATYGSRTHPVTGEEIRHDGVDFALPAGTPVLAAAQGVVESAGYDNARGNAIVLRHGETLTHYFHLSEIDVEQGQTVKAKERIGAVGSTGNSTGPHLHFSVQEDGEFVDPLLLLESGES